ncbi:MAG: hypothetical protein P1U63_01110 [Coxiellaceae bacterium]|nr:hypothetical protein [Coxiellaceae bacterium]
MQSSYDKLIELLPISMLAQWRNPEFSPNDDDDLIKDIEQNGLVDPVVIGVGIWSRRIRLDTGNHRIYLCPEMGITHLPTIARVWNYCAFENGNGDHSFPCDHIALDKQWIDDEYYAKPGQIINFDNIA